MRDADSSASLNERAARVTTIKQSYITSPESGVYGVYAARGTNARTLLASIFERHAQARKCVSRYR